jgi:hypothetical protein
MSSLAVLDLSSLGEPSALSNVIERLLASHRVGIHDERRHHPLPFESPLGRARATGPACWDQCIVVNGQRTVLGRLGRSALAEGDDTTVDEAMSEGPSTIRPNARLDDVLERLKRQNLETAIVTTSSCWLVGVDLHNHLSVTGNHQLPRR